MNIEHTFQINQFTITCSVIGEGHPAQYEEDIPSITLLRALDSRGNDVALKLPEEVISDMEDLLHEQLEYEVRCYFSY